MKVISGLLVALKEKRINDLYILLRMVDNDNYYIASVQNDDLLYILLRHVIKKGLVYLFKQGVLGKKPLSSLKFSEHCVLGK